MSFLLKTKPPENEKELATSSGLPTDLENPKVIPSPPKKQVNPQLFQHLLADLQKIKHTLPPPTEEEKKGGLIPKLPAKAASSFYFIQPTFRFAFRSEKEIQSAG